MAKLTKKQKEAQSKIESNKAYSVAEASALIKEVANENFDASVDLAVRLNVDPRKANQMVRGVVTLPHGTGKDVKVLALVTPDKEEEAKEAGADYVGLDEYLDKIKGGWTDVDVIIMLQKQYLMLKLVKLTLKLIKPVLFTLGLEKHLLKLKKLLETRENY